MIVDGLSDALDLSRTIGADTGVADAYERGRGMGTLGEVDFYASYVVVHMTWPHLIKLRSHEHLMFDYETPLTCEMDGTTFCRLLPQVMRIFPLAPPFEVYD